MNKTQTVYKFFSENWLIIAVILILVSSSNLFLDPTQPIKFILLGLLCFTGNLWVILSKQKLNLSNSASLFIKLFLLFIYINIFSAVFFNTAFKGSYEIIKLFLYLNFLLLAILNSKRFNKDSISVGFSIFQYLVIIATTIIDLSEFSIEKIFTNKILGGLFVNPNLTSQLLLLSIPLILIGINKKKSKKLFYFQLIGVSLSLLFILILNSKTVWFALFISTLLSIWLYAIYRYKSKRKWLISFAIIGFVLSGFLIHFNWEKVQNIHSIKERTEIWTRTIKLIQDNPILGAGLSNWDIANLNYVPTNKIENGSHKNLGLYKAHGNLYYNRPHNDFLWVMSELGIIGLISYLAIITLLFTILFSSLKKGTNLERIRSSIIFSGLISYFIIAQFSYPKERIEQSIILIIFVVLIVTKPGKKSKWEFSHIFILPFIFISLFSLYIGITRASSDYYMNIVKQSKFKKNWPFMLYNAHNAENSFYPFSSDGQPVKLQQGIAAIHLEKFKEAHQSFIDAKSLNPNQVFTLSNLGTTHTIKGNIDSAKYYYRAALKINPKFEDPRMNLVALYFNENKIDSAWYEIKKIPITSTHNKMKPFINALVKVSFENELQLAASKEFEKKTINNYRNSYKFNYYTLFKKSILNQTSIEFEYLKAIRGSK